VNALRVVPATAVQLAADAEAPALAIFRSDLETLTLASSAAGLGIERRGEEAWIRASARQLEALRRELESRQSPLAAALGRYLAPIASWRLRTRSLALDEAHIMGIVNLTSDSFSGDGVGTEVSAALARADQLRRDGACLVDVGAESARADRPVLEEAAEAELVGRVVEALVREGHVVSSDTYKRAVAEAALAAGAECVNDISGLTLGTGAAEAACAAGAGYVLNYSYSVPKRRPLSPPQYDDVVDATNDWFAAGLLELERAGLERDAIAIDPGIAFGKSHDEDLQVLRRVGEFAVHGQPLLLAHSRKNYIGSVAGMEPAARDLETHIASVLAFAAGVRVFRVHDVAGTRRALDMAAAIQHGKPGDYAPGGSSWPWRAGADAAHMTAGEPDKQAPGGQRW
jgi:dihydropteroate synthase